MPAIDFEKRADLELRWRQLSEERVSFERRWRELGDYILPTRPRFFQSDRGRGDKARTKVVDSTATLALRIATSGLLDGMASPQRPWFKLTVPDKGMADLAPVTSWLEDVRTALLGVFDRSNLYNALGELFRDELVFGTAVLLVFDDPKSLVRFEVVPVGAYYLAQDDKGRVNTLGREMSMPVRQVVARFGEDALDSHTRELYRARSLEKPVVVRHLIEPNPDAQPGRLGRQFLPFREVYWIGQHQASTRTADTPDWGANQDIGTGLERGHGILEIGGFHEFPAMIARWSRTTDDVYATDCPGMDALGDIKQLQAMTEDKNLAIEKSVDPPMQGPPELDARDVGMTPGAYSQVEDSSQGVRPTHEVRINLADLREEVREVQHRIDRAMLRDFFQMLQSLGTTQPLTAEEVRAREAERAAVLGPILERHSDDVFDPLIDRVSAILYRKSLMDWQRGEDSYLPMPPEELEDVDIKVQYVSEVAQAQRFVHLGAIERHLQLGGAMAELKPDVLDGIDMDAMLREAGEILGIDPRLLREAEVLVAIREERAQMERAAMQTEQVGALAKAARDLGSTQMGAGSALDRVVS